LRNKGDESGAARSAASAYSAGVAVGSAWFWLITALSGCAKGGIFNNTYMSYSTA
jgi:hypothetical protein